jgi:hypothetical protein
MARRFLHFEVLCCTAKYWYRYGAKFLHSKIKFYFRAGTGNPPSVYKQLSPNSSRTGKNSQAGPKIFVVSGMSILRIFRLIKQILGFF